MADLLTLSEDSLRRLADMLRRDDYRPANSPRPQPPTNTDVNARLVRLARTCTNADYPTYPTEPANCYLVEFGEYVPAAAPAPGVVALEFEPYDPAECRLVLTRPEDEYIPEGTVIDIALHHGRWWTVMPEGISLPGACLAEEHPGRGIPFAITLGEWDPAEDEWIYTDGPAAVAIDWRYGVPYPDAGATGLFIPRPSDTHGTIYEVVALDCVSPGPCEGS